MTRHRPLKVGLYIPNGVGYMADGVHRWDQMLGLAKLAEETGFDSVWIADHMLFRFEGDAETQGRWEAWTMLGALAAVTSRVEIGPLVSCMSFRNPALLAKMAETVDEISNGRLLLALGAGWHEPEYTAYGFPYDHRASRFEEGFSIVKSLIRTGKADFHGQFHSVTNAEMAPRGPRAGQIPLILGTNGTRLLKLCAAEADGWNTTWLRNPSEVAPLREAVDAACAEVGRDPRSLSRSACIFVALEGWNEPFRFWGDGTPDRRSTAGVAELFAEYAAEGIDHVMIWPNPYSAGSIEQIGEALALLDRG